MVKSGSDKSPAAALLIALGACWLSGCASGTNAPANAPATASRRDSLPPAGSANRAASSAAPAPAATWSLVLGTFTEPGHEEAARLMIMNLGLIAPDAQRGARVYTSSKGSSVVYGSYRDSDDPRRAADQKRLSEMRYDGYPVFKRVMLAHLDAPITGTLHPFDLRSARQAHPRVDPLYTLDVAIWLSNDDRKLGEIVTYDEVKRQAEAYAQSLRARGFEAYFYHDDQSRQSTVTVGLFDRTAINDVSGLYNRQLTDLVKQFPERLTNGMPSAQPVNPYRLSENDPVKPVTPVLVLVPN